MFLKDQFDLAIWVDLIKFVILKAKIDTFFIKQKEIA